VASGERWKKLKSNNSNKQSMESYQDLEVWQKGMDLAQSAYALTKSFPKEELFGLTSQIRRAASSVPANIAEGWARRSSKDFQRFLNLANGSLRELETHLILSQRVGLAQEPHINNMLAQTSVLGRQILALHRALDRKQP
jgi:four helix bundle protein